MLTRSGALPPESRWFTGAAERFVFTGRAGEAAARRAAAGRAEVAALGEGASPPADVLAFLAGRGMRRVLLEGGGEALWDFVEAGLVDVLHVTLTPWLAGGRAAPTLLGGGGFPSGGLVRLRLEQVRPEGDEVFLRYRVLPGRGEGEAAPPGGKPPPGGRR